MNFDIFSPRSCRRRNIGSFWETIAETLLWIFNMLFKPLWILVLRLRLTILDALHRFREVPHVAPLLI